MLKFFFKRNISLPILGRWSIPNCEFKVGRKVDLSNEDHCGCCYESNKEVFRDRNEKDISSLESKLEYQKDDKYLIYLF